MGTYLSGCSIRHTSITVRLFLVSVWTISSLEHNNNGNSRNKNRWARCKSGNRTKHWTPTRPRVGRLLVRRGDVSGQGQASPQPWPPCWPVVGARQHTTPAHNYCITLFGFSHVWAYTTWTVGGSLSSLISNSSLFWKWWLYGILAWDSQYMKTAYVYPFSSFTAKQFFTVTLSYSWSSYRTTSVTVMFTYTSAGRCTVHNIYT